MEDASYYSIRNFQRLFKKEFQETLRSYKKRLRLEVAYKKMVYTNDAIVDIATDVGYESVAAFSKAFKIQFKISPSNARKNKKNIFNNFIEKATNYSDEIYYEIVFKSSIDIFYKLILTNNYNNDVIGITWKSIEDDTIKYKNVNSFGLIVDQPLISDSTKCRYEACVDVNPNKKEYLTKQIFGKKYIKFIHKGSYTTIEDTYRQIYYNWMYYLDFEIDASPIVECYKNNATNSNSENDFLTEILFPLKE